MYLMNDQGLFEPYDDNYDVVIHCDSEEARDGVIADLKAINDRLDVLDKIREEVKKIFNDRPSCYNHPQRTKFYVEVLQIIDKHKTESEGEI